MRYRQLNYFLSIIKSKIIWFERNASVCLNLWGIWLSRTALWSSSSVSLSSRILYRTKNKQFIYHNSDISSLSRYIVFILHLVTAHLIFQKCSLWQLSVNYKQTAEYVSCPKSLHMLVFLCINRLYIQQQE